MSLDGPGPVYRFEQKIKCCGEQISERLSSRLWTKSQKALQGRLHRANRHGERGVADDVAHPYKMALGNVEEIMGHTMRHINTMVKCCQEQRAVAILSKTDGAICHPGTKLAHFTQEFKGQIDGLSAPFLQTSKVSHVMFHDLSEWAECIAEITTRWKRAKRTNTRPCAAACTSHLHGGVEADVRQLNRHGYRNKDRLDKKDK